MSQFADKNLTCRDCGKQFTFTAGEQEFYQSRGFSAPTRCADCRAARKASQGSGGSYGSRSDSGRSSYGSSSGGYGSSRSSSSRGGSSDYQGGGATKPMFKVTCANCGVETEVPFEPRSGRPVYCRDCYQQMGGGNRR